MEQSKGKTKAYHTIKIYIYFSEKKKWDLLMKTSKNTPFLAEKKNVSWQKPIKEWIHFVYLDLKNVCSCKMEKKTPKQTKPTIQPSVLLRLWSS